MCYHPARLCSCMCSSHGAVTWQGSGGSKGLKQLSWEGRSVRRRDQGKSLSLLLALFALLAVYQGVFRAQVADMERLQGEAAAAAAEVVRLQNTLAVAQASAQAESTSSRIAGLEGKVREAQGFD